MYVSIFCTISNHKNTN